MNNVMYLIHLTDISNLKKILETGEIYNELKRGYNQIESLGYTTTDNKNPLLTADGQFPGVYMIVVDSIRMRNTPTEIPGNEVAMVFCPDILKRGDFHFNKHDWNGYLIENMTLFTLSELLTHINNGELSPDNEIIFHNSVSLRYLKELWVGTRKQEARAKAIVDNLGLRIPIRRVTTHEPIISNCNIDTSYAADYCYYLHDFVKTDRPDEYQIISSPEWYKRMVGFCDVNAQNVDEKQEDPQKWNRLLRRPIYETKHFANNDAVKRYLINQGVTPYFVHALDRQTLKYLRKYMTVVDVKKLILYSQYDFSNSETVVPDRDTRKWIKRYPQFFSDMLNVWIVYHRGRSACLIESTMYEPNTFENSWLLLQLFIHSLKLHFYRDLNALRPRYLVTRSAVQPNFTEQEIKHALGMSYIKPDYVKGSMLRTTLQIYAFSGVNQYMLWMEISTEPQVSIDNAQRLLFDWQNILRVHPFPYDKTVQLTLRIHEDTDRNIR
jgi:hypothetical protein